MPRRARPQRREPSPDTKYQSLLVSRFINKLMLRGQKATAERILYSALDILQKQSKKNPVEVLELAVQNARPLVQVKPRRVAGATYQVPVEVSSERGHALAIIWLTHSARARKGASMVQRLAAELMDASQGQGPSVKRREDLHKMAEANRAFAHYRW